jgi:hypothetical protein
VQWCQTHVSSGVLQKYSSNLIDQEGLADNRTFLHVSPIDIIHEYNKSFLCGALKVQHIFFATVALGSADCFWDTEQLH